MANKPHLENRPGTDLPGLQAALVRYTQDLQAYLDSLVASVNAVAGGAVPTGPAGGQLGGTYPDPDVRGVRETGGPTELTMGAVADGTHLKRSGATVVGDATVVEGSGANNRVALWSGAQTQDSDANLTYDGSSLVAASSQIRAGTSVRVGQANAGGGSGADENVIYGSGSDILLAGHWEFSAPTSNKWELQVWDGSVYRSVLRGDLALTSLGTGAVLLVNVAGTKTTPRVMMGPAANVGKTFVVESFAGRNGAGAITAANLVAGDVVVNLVGVSAAVLGSQAANFEGTVTVNGQIQQSAAGDLTANSYLVFIERRSATGATNERPLYVVP